MKQAYIKRKVIRLACRVQSGKPINGYLHTRKLWTVSAALTSDADYLKHLRMRISDLQPLLECWSSWVLMLLMGGSDSNSNSPPRVDHTQINCSLFPLDLLYRLPRETAPTLIITSQPNFPGNTPEDLPKGMFLSWFQIQLADNQT